MSSLLSRRLFAEAGIVVHADPAIHQYATGCCVRVLYVFPVENIAAGPAGISHIERLGWPVHLLTSSLLVWIDNEADQILTGRVLRAMDT